MLWNGNDAELTDETGGRKVWKNFAASRELMANVEGNEGFVLIYGAPVSNIEKSDCQYDKIIKSYWQKVVHHAQL